MSDLGVSFDCKINRQIQIENTITKAKRVLNAIKLILKHFNKQELLNLIMANNYSILNNRNIHADTSRFGIASYIVDLKKFKCICGLENTI